MHPVRLLCRHFMAYPHLDKPDQAAALVAAYLDG